MNITNAQIQQLEAKLNGNPELKMLVFGNSGKIVAEVFGPIQLIVDEGGAEPVLKLEGHTGDCAINLTDLEGIVVQPPDQQIESVIAGNNYFKFLSTMTDWITGEDWANTYFEDFDKCYLAELELQLGDETRSLICYWSKTWDNGALLLNIPSIQFVGNTLWVEIRGLWTVRNTYPDVWTDLYAYIQGTNPPHHAALMGETTMQFHLNNLKYLRVAKLAQLYKLLPVP